MKEFEKLTQDWFAAMAAADAKFREAHFPPPAPQPYAAPTHRDVCVPPPVPVWGPANSILADATFGSRILRVTDAQINPEPGYAGRSYIGCGSAEQHIWNSDGTRFYVTGPGGELWSYRFDATTFQVQRDDEWLLPHVQADACWSYDDPNLLYGALGTKVQCVRVGHVLVSVEACDLGADAGTISGVSVSSQAPNVVLACAYGGQQDTWTKVLAYDLTAGTRRDLTSPHPLHNARIDRTGRFVVITYAGGGLAVWTIALGTVVDLTLEAGGHYALGYGFMVNNAAVYDALDWRERSLTTPDLPPLPLAVPRPQPTAWECDDHPSWHNASPDRKMPFITSTFRVEPLSAGHDCRYWDDEILAVAPDGTVYRFAHHHSLQAKPPIFEDEVFANVSSCGKYALFSSNMGGTLGLDPQGQLRRDVFLLELN